MSTQRLAGMVAAKRRALKNAVRRLEEKDPRLAIWAIQNSITDLMDAYNGMVNGLIQKEKK